MSLASLAITFVFIIFSICVSRRLYHLFIVPQHPSEHYHSGKYARTFQYLLLLYLPSSALTRPLPPENLLLALWNRSEWNEAHGILHPSLQYRTSESLFQILVFTFLISIFMLLIALLTRIVCHSSSPSSSSGGRSSNLRRLSQNSLVTLLLYTPSAHSVGVPINSGTFQPFTVQLPDQCHFVPNATWEHIPFNKLWHQVSEEQKEWHNPISMYSNIFGYAVAEGATTAEKYFSGLQYWTNVTEMECKYLCEREIVDIHPFIHPDLLLKQSTIVKRTGNLIRHRWK